MQRPPILLWLPLLLLVASGCARPLDPVDPVPVGPVAMEEGEWRVVDHVIVVTDASGTMYYRETFPEAKAITRAFVASMPPATGRARNPGTYEAGLIGFGGDERAVAPLSSFDRPALRSAADDLEILGSVKLGTGGTTPLHVVLSEVQAALSGRSGQAAVVIVTDGVADLPDEAQRAAQEMAASYPDKLCLHTVQVGSDPAGAEFLGRLSQATACGSARTAASVATDRSFESFTHSVFAGAPPELPAVSAAGPCEGVIRLRGIQFGFDRDDITPASRAVLGVAADRLRECQSLVVDVVGHTDSTGPAAYNQGLSERRARSTEHFLHEEGIEARRLATQGRGEDDPIASNDTREGRALNRRVELIPQR